ncbi:endonuclease domain-containing protein [Geomonas anaerohicana]|uniref:Endonuclease domain-containing protein n=1 Tax=Geomonas anaerohicana TaxID=2798583 RepID=A0ABS0Y9K9_9BACT|nr:endonuclease domain-containing protein [Geomonas anaerohicana]MBJ6748654.1 endonuclease domain-containing protein [Geomonas anaerohicana]
MDADNPIFDPPPLPTELLKAARMLRQHMTDAEQLLWFCLRRKQMGGFRFRRQHPVEKFVLDFYCAEARLAVELDGGQHNQPLNALRDRGRTDFLEAQGISLLRIWNHELFVNLEGVLERIYEVLLQRVGVSYGRNKKLPPP